MKYFLIADDSEAKMMLLKGLVEHSKMDVKILEAETTQQAKEWIDAHPDIAYAWIDYNIPTEDGPAVIGYLIEKNPAAHIALVTSMTENAYRDEALAAGAEAVIGIAENPDRAVERLSDLLLEWRE